MLGTSADSGDSGRRRGLLRIIDRSAVMRVAMRGEHIARGASRLNVRNRAGAGTLRGSPYPLACLSDAVAGSGEPETHRYSGAPAKTAIHRRVRRSAREESGRRSEQGFRWYTLEGTKPKGASSGRRANPSSGRQGLSKGSKPRSRGLLGRPTASAAGIPTGRTASGCIRVVTPRIPFER
jgi:hypothetical protein